MAVYSTKPLGKNPALTDEREFRHRLRRATATMVAALGVPILMLLVLVALLFQSATWVDHTDRVISEAYRLEKIMFNAQASFRGFRLAGDEVYLRPYLSARDAVPLDLGLLRKLTADNATQGQALVRIERAIKATFDYTDAELAAINTGRTQARDVEFIRTSAPLFEQVQASLEEFLLREHELRTAREDTLRRWKNATLIVFGVAILIGLPLVAGWLRRLLFGITRSYREAHSAAERRAAELQVTLTSIGDAVIATDGEGGVEFLNPVAEALTGWTDAEARGRPLPEVFRIFNERSGVMVDNPVERVLRENITVGLANHTVLRSRDGQDRAIEDSAAPIRSQDGAVRGAILVFHDVSARREEERLLEDSEERFRLLAQMVSLQVWTAGVDGNFDYANEECEKYFGADLNREALGNVWEQFVHPDDRAAALRAWKTSISTGQPFETEFRLRSHDGEYRWFLVRAQAKRDPAGRVMKWFGTNTEVDALRRAKAEAERASRSKDDFIATLSHELRTPLTPVLMTAAALREDEALPLEVREQLGMIERNIALEARLIDDLLDVTALSKGKMRLLAQLSDIHSLIGLAAEIVRDEAQVKEVSIQRDLAATRSGSNVDPARFQQVIWNLLRNAVKFTPRGGKISLTSRDMA
ncbi:MAG: domain S-box protein, partial [Verrucomicrobia bacterium]|nr:domain S-box protein [Verrucomicrobiota bacterium]